MQNVFGSNERYAVHFLLVLIFNFLFQFNLVVNAQERSGAEKSSESDTTTLFPSAIKEFSDTLDVGNRKVPVNLQYAVQGQTIFVLPVWVIGDVKRVVDDKEQTVKPDARLISPDESGTVRLIVAIRNLLDDQELEKAVIEKLRQRVLDQQGLEAGTKLKIERPNINLSAIRFTLIGGGRGDDDSPAEIAIANPVARTADGLLSFTLDPEQIRKIEIDRSLKSGLLCASVSILPTGPMKVRFETLEMEAQLRYLRATLDDFRKKVGSQLSNSSGQPPDFVVPLGGAGLAQTRNQLRTLLTQSLQVTVRTRQGASELPLMPFLEKTVESMLNTSQLDTTNDQQRVAFLLENQVTITSTLGQIKNASKLDEKSRADQIRQASDHYFLTRDNKTSDYTGSLTVQAVAYGEVGLGGGSSSTDLKERENMEKSQREKFKQAFDKLVQEFQGEMPVLSGIQLTDETLTSSARQTEAEFQKTSFLVDYTLHRFMPLPLSGTLDAQLPLAELLREYAILKADRDKMLELVGVPETLLEAKAMLKQIQLISKDLENNKLAFERAITEFESYSKSLLLKLDQNEVLKLKRELAQLKEGLLKTGALDVVIENSIGMRLKSVPGGTFFRGDSEGNKEQTPHQVTLTQSFYLGVYEVTQQQYEQVVGKNPSKFKGSLNPVENVSWDDAVEFCKRLSELPEEKVAGRVYRLPTEAEWEYACRAGSQTKYSFGDNESNLSYFAWFRSNSDQKTHPVGEKMPNAWGFYDMYGNVWEWVSDWHGEYPRGVVSDPTGPREGSLRVLRGGGWGDFSASCRSASRHGDDPSNRGNDYGFRVALSPPGIPK
jgi:formylglycine-generating enzyme required for sulfatase activity